MHWGWGRGGGGEGIRLTRVRGAHTGGDEINPEGREPLGNLQCGVVWTAGDRQGRAYQYSLGSGWRERLEEG